MKKYLLCAAALFFLANCGDSSSTKSDPALTTMLETQWSEYTKTLPESGGGIAIYMMTPKGNYFASTGIENATPDTHFRAASNTKTFTAAAVMLLHQEGKLDINHLITSNIPGTSEPYIPETSDFAIPYKNQITIRELLSHRAGVFDIGNSLIPASCDAPYAGMYYTEYIRAEDANHTFSIDELVRPVAHCGLSYFAPGTGYHYSNTGYSMLVKIIERVSGLPYAEFLKEHLFDPNELYDTTAPHLGTDRQIAEPNTAGYYLYQGKLFSVDNDNVSENIGEGNIISSLADLGRWVRHLITGQAGLTPATVSQMTECVSQTSEVTCYGLGLFFRPTAPHGIGHNGAHMGYMSLMLHDPEKDITAVLFANLLDFDNIAEEQAVFARVWMESYKVLGY